jgi:release factor glutamine methyltransferase
VVSGATHGSLLAHARALLREAGLETPDLDARLLTAAALEVTQMALLVRSEAPANREAETRLRSWLDRRASGEPVARILGFQEFWGLTFSLSAETLVPRPETETLVEAALAALKDRNTALRLLDLGTGTGCLLISLLTELPGAVGTGIDLSADALVTARSNAERLGVGERALFVHGDWAEPVAGQFDLVLSNPPYIPSPEIAGLEAEVRVYDPMLALDGGVDGLDAYRALASVLPQRLAPWGIAVIELGIGQESDVAYLMAEAGLTVSGPARPDLLGIPRALVVSAPA